MKNTLNKIKIDGKMIRRLIMTVVGIYLTAVSVAIFRKAVLGVDPFTVLVEAMENVSGYRYGIVFPIVQVILLIITFIFGRKYINFGTLLTLFCIGFLVDKTSIVLNYILPNPNLPQRAITLTIGLILVCFAGSLYMTANLGVSAYDAMALIIHDRTKKVPFRICRIGTDLVCVIIGFIFHANIDIGTLVTALFMGPLVQFFNQKISIPIMNGRK